MIVKRDAGSIPYVCGLHLYQIRDYVISSLLVDIWDIEPQWTQYRWGCCGGGYYHANVTLNWIDWFHIQRAGGGGGGVANVYISGATFSDGCNEVIKHCVM